MATKKYRQMTVGELVLALNKLPATAIWYGWQDETIIVEEPAPGGAFWVIDPAQPTT